MQKQVPLHGLKPGQLLHLGVALLVVCPHTEGTLHQQLPQVTEVSLEHRTHVGARKAGETWVGWGSGAHWKDYYTR